MTPIFWKKLAKQAVRPAIWMTTPIDALYRRAVDPLLPPAHLRIFYYRTLQRDAFARMCTGASAELLSRGLLPAHRVLDIGSGIGNLAIGLLPYLRGGYDGIEVHKDAAAWCTRAITRRHPDFRFHWADIAGGSYNATGRMASSAFRFPFPDASFDFIFVGSVFTHMDPAGIQQYAREMSRVLAAGGTCIASYFLLTEHTRAGIDAGRSFIPFPARHSSGVALLHDAARPEAAIAYEEAFVRRTYDAVGLSIADVRRGQWWNGAAHEQDVLTIRHSLDAERPSA